MKYIIRTHFGGSSQWWNGVRWSPEFPDADQWDKLKDATAVAKGIAAMERSIIPGLVHVVQVGEGQNDKVERSF